MNAVRPSTDAFLDFVEHRQSILVGLRADIEIFGGGDLLFDRRHLVEVRCEEAEGTYLVRYLLCDGPGKSEALIGRRATTKLVHDDEAVARRRLHHSRGLDHL